MKVNDVVVNVFVWQPLPHVAPSDEHCAMYPVALVTEFHDNLKLVLDTVEAVADGAFSDKVAADLVVDHEPLPDAALALTLK